MSKDTKAADVSSILRIGETGLIKGPCESGRRVVQSGWVFIMDAISLVKGHQGGRRVVQSNRVFIKDAISLVKGHQSGRRVVQSNRVFIKDAISLVKGHQGFGVSSNQVGRLLT